jgi:hypothetical protein
MSKNAVFAVVQEIEVRKADGAYQYALGDVRFDVRDLAASLPGGFNAGETEQEHRSLILLAACNGSLPEQVSALAK